MKLSSLPSPPQQIFPATRALSAAVLAAGLLLAAPLSALAQQKATITVQTGAGPQTTNGEVIGVSGGRLNFRFTQQGQGVRELSIPLTQVTAIIMDPPKEFAEGNQAYQEGNNMVALAKLGFVQTQYKGIPTPWMGSTLGRLGEVFINLGQYDKAEEIFKEYEATFGTGENALPQAELGKAQIALAKGEAAEARQVLETVVEDSKNLEAVTEEQSNFYGRAFFTLGQVQESANELAQALESYLKVVTLYYRDSTLLKAAQDKADALRQANPELTVP